MEALLEAKRFEEAKSIGALFRADNPRYSPEEQSHLDRLLNTIDRASKGLPIKSTTPTEENSTTE